MDNQLLRVDIDRDLGEIMKLITKYMEKTYIKEIEKEMLECARKCEHNQTKEVELLRALIPFVPEEKQETMEQVVKMMVYDQIVKQTLPKLITLQQMRGEGESKSLDSKGKELVGSFILYKLLFNLEKKGH
ncbi:MAG: hypothetical protein ACRCW2_09915 [Cellulosilyticaceae bacterium]